MVQTIPGSRSRIVPSISRPPSEAVSSLSYGKAAVRRSSSAFTLPRSTDKPSLAVNTYREASATTGLRRTIESRTILPSTTGEPGSTYWPSSTSSRSDRKVSSWIHSRGLVGIDESRWASGQPRLSMSKRAARRSRQVNLPMSLSLSP